MRKPQYDMTIFQQRRSQLASKMGGAALILPSHPNHIRNNDVHHPYRQDTNLFYMTGFEEPGSVFIFRPGRRPESVMFVRRKDKERETWDGFRYGVDGTKSEFGMDEVYPIDQFEKIAPTLLSEVDKIYYTLFNDFEFDARLSRVMVKVKSLRGRGGRGILPIEDSYPFLGEMRLIKSAYEAEMLRKACEITAQSHVDVMRATKPGVNERALHGIFIKGIMTRGAAREGYGTIVAGGANATTLHYVFNDQDLKADDLLLIDAGGEYAYYTSDITRTYPVSGKFTPIQRDLYQGVLEIQKHLVDMVRPGVEHKELQTVTIEKLVDLMLQQKIMTGSKEQIITERLYVRYYPHGVGHWLGSDVHDAGVMDVDGKPRLLEPNMCTTIEPGIYIPADDDLAPEPFRGIGIRIEDDILVTAEGHENLTASAPKEIADLEAVVGTDA